MPIFEYRCGACGHVFEVLSASAARATSGACPRCGAADVERAWSTFSARTPAGTGCSAPRGGFG